MNRTLKEFAQQLGEGADGSEILEQMRRRYKTTASLSSKASLVRNEAIRILNRRHIATLLEIDDVHVRLFLDASLHRKLKMMADLTVFPAAAQDVMRRMDLAPVNMDSFKLSSSEVLACKRTSQAAILKKNDGLIVVRDAETMLTCARLVVRNADASSFTSLACALMLLCGRRMGEIMNGRSDFSRVEHEYHVRFAGQLKKQGDACEYVIPILTTADAFLNGVEVLRSRQPAHVPSLSNQKITQLYQGNLNRQLQTMFPFVPKIHGLRSCYIAYVELCFVTRVTFNRLAMLCLGHDQLQESLSYNNVRLEQTESLKDHLGELFLLDQEASG